MMHSVTACLHCGILSNHTGGAILGFTFERATKVYHRDCLIVVANAVDSFYLPAGSAIPPGFKLVEA